MKTISNLTKDQKVQLLKDYLIKCGGACQFHTIEDICLAVNDKHEIVKITIGKETKENPFGVIKSQFAINDNEKLFNRIVKKLLIIHIKNDKIYFKLQL